MIQLAWQPGMRRTALRAGVALGGLAICAGVVAPVAQASIRPLWYEPTGSVTWYEPTISPLLAHEPTMNSRLVISLGQGVVMSIQD